MERLHLRSTSLPDILAELRERDLLREANERRRAARPHPVTRGGLPGLAVLGRRLLG